MSISVKRMRREAVLRELHSLNIGQTRCASLMGMHVSGISVLAKSMGLQFRKLWTHKRSPKSIARAQAMAALYRQGYTLGQIGEQHGISRERVRQLMSRHLGIRAEDGGKRVKADRRAAVRAAKHDAKALTKWGCSFAQWQELVAIGKQMMAKGVSKSRTPTSAFSHQRHNAAKRGIAWELNLWQWWCIWQQSGHWEDRGRGQGYCMCRVGDVGPYAPGNVFIATAAQNSSEANRKQHELPIGVKATKSGRYVAHRRINGVLLRLGTHDTPDLAYAAYLMAGQHHPMARAA